MVYGPWFLVDDAWINRHRTGNSHHESAKGGKHEKGQDLFHSLNLRGLRVLRGAKTVFLVAGCARIVPVLRAWLVKAGPFHPSFGELVEQAVFKEQARYLLMRFQEQAGAQSDLDLYVERHDISKVTGSRRWIISHLCQEFGLDYLRVRPVSMVERNWVGISKAGAPQIELFLSRQEFLAGKAADNPGGDK